HFGALVFIFGTLYTSLLALLLAVPLSLGVAIFLSELAPAHLRGPISALVELLAAVPSVVYGLWGIFVLTAVVRSPVETWLGAHYAGRRALCPCRHCRGHHPGPGARRRRNDGRDHGDRQRALYRPLALRHHRYAGQRHRQPVPGGDGHGLPGRLARVGLDPLRAGDCPQ